MGLCRATVFESERSGMVMYIRVPSRDEFSSKLETNFNLLSALASSNYDENGVA